MYDEKHKEIILKEKNKKEPNKDIQFLQQLLDKQDSVRHLISEMKQRQYLRIRKTKLINMDDWFAYDGVNKLKNIKMGKN